MKAHDAIIRYGFSDHTHLGDRRRCGLCLSRTVATFVEGKRGHPRPYR